MKFDSFILKLASAYSRLATYGQEAPELPSELQQEIEELENLSEYFKETSMKLDDASDGEELYQLLEGVEDIKSQFETKFLALVAKAQTIPNIKETLRDIYDMYNAITEDFDSIREDYSDFFKPSAAIVQEEKVEEALEGRLQHRREKAREDWKYYYQSLPPAQRSELYRKVRERQQEQLGKEKYLEKKRKEFHKYKKPEIEKRRKQKHKAKSRESMRDKRMQERLEKLKRMLS